MIFSNKHNKYLIFTIMVAVIAIIGMVMPVANASNKLLKKKTIKDLDYGEALYYFYQKDYFDAARVILVAKELNLLKNQPQDADLLLGGIYLQYGLHQDAEGLFGDLLNAQAPPELRDRIWYNIGKLRYEKGLQDDAIRAFEQISGALGEDAFNDSQLLMANMLMNRKQYDQAAKILEKLPKDSINATFAQYNLGIALYRSGKRLEGENFMAQVGSIETKDKELLALRDKANLALGYALLGDNESNRARAFFQKVRLKGPFSNKALLGFGWSHAMQKDYEAALGTWLELRGREKNDSSVYESLLAVGYALEQLKAYPQAMQSYLDAIKLFKEEIDRLDAAVKRVKTGKLMNQLVAEAMGKENAHLTEAKLLKDAPEFRFITGIVSSHRFTDAIKTLTDLSSLKELLAKWSESFPVYEDMLRLRRQAYEERLPKLMPEKGVYKIAAIKDERDLYEEEYKRIVFEHDIFSVATDKERKSMARLDQVESLLKSAARQMDAGQYGNFEYKYHLFRGLLEWDISTTFNERVWEIRKNLNGLNKEIEKTQKSEKNLENAKNRAPRGFEGYNRQIKHYEKQIAILQKQIDNAYGLQKQQVQNIIVEELSWLRDRLADYLDQAQFSLANLQDRASQ